jgi:excinuclease ABC subunit C
MIYREGKLVGAQNHSFIDNVQGDADLLESLLVQFYTAQSTIPHEVYLPVDVEESDLIGELLSEGKRRTMKIFCPLKGEKKKLVDMALSNAEATFKQERDEEALREKMLLEMQELFSLNNYPTRIECFDNSNLAGTEPVAAMVVFSHGQKDGARYRMYKVKTVEGPDDYGTMVEILRRRYQRAKDEGDLPDLIIVDGGKGQLSSAMKVLRELDISTVDVIGLAKEKGRHDKGMTSEQVFLPGAKEPIRLDRSSPILFLMQNIRDEAHRFAITFHRKRRSKAAFSCALDTIPGIGPTKKKRLLKHFGSVKRVKAATEEELKAIPGITKKDIEQILLF